MSRRLAGCLLLAASTAAIGQSGTDSKTVTAVGLKTAAIERVDDSRKLAQEIVDSLFSFSELG